MSDPKNGPILDAMRDGKIAVCVKDVGKTVLQQNSVCVAVCGDQTGQVCELGCMELYARDQTQQWQDWGTRVYQNSNIHGDFYDVTLVCSSNYLITLLQPLAEKYELALDYYKQKGLTARETEVIALTIQGVSNPSICRRLSISKATLRTHLNNIYNKLREQGDKPDFIPPTRMSH